MVDVDGDAEVCGGLELVDELVGLGEGVDGGAVAGIHGVEGFDGEFDVGLLCGREDGGDAVGGLLSGVVEWDGGVCAADEDDEWGAELVSLFDGEEVVVDGGLAFCAGGCWEEAAAAEAGDGEAGVA